MIAVTTRRGKRIDLISLHELRDPITVGLYVRAYCPIHHSDHQRSLSVNRKTGWGHCFNAACQALVLVEEWNPRVASNITHRSLAGGFSVPTPAVEASLRPAKPPLARQPVLLYPPKDTPEWQRQELLTLRTVRKALRQSLAYAPRAEEYLAVRGIVREVAMAAGVGYFSRKILGLLGNGERQRVERWTDRIVFPLVSPVGEGYIGRTLWGWQSGMDENRHKALLERAEGPKRWVKTNPAGWFSVPLYHLAERIILVEGGFDRLALLAAGFDATTVVALVGTAAPVDWFPPQVKSVVLALDGDQGGKEATERLGRQLTDVGFAVSTCLLPQDRWGKDWNERWRTLKQEAMQPLIETYRSMGKWAQSA